MAVCAVEVIIDFRMRSVRIQSTKKGGLHRPIIEMPVVKEEAVNMSSVGGQVNHFPKPSHCRA